MAAPASMSKLKPPASASAPSPAPAPPRAMHDLPPVEDRTHIVRERVFQSTVGLDEVARVLFSARSTGKLTVNYSHGVISGTMTFEERQRIVADSDVAESTT